MKEDYILLILMFLGIALFIVSIFAIGWLVFWLGKII